MSADELIAILSKLKDRTLPVIVETSVGYRPVTSVEMSEDSVVLCTVNE